MKNKLTVTRGEGEVTREERDNNQGKKGKGCQGTCIKHPWTKPRRVCGYDGV